MTPTAVVFFAGFIPALLLGWVGGTLTERHKRMTEPKSRRITRDNLLIGIVVTALVLAVIAAVYAYNGKTGGETRDEQNFECLARFVSTGQENSKPATLANRAQLSALRDAMRGYSEDPEAQGLSPEQLKNRWLTLFKVYENSQTQPLPDLVKFCSEDVTR